MGRKAKNATITIDRTPVIRVKLAPHRPAVGPFGDMETARLYAKNNLPERFGMTREEAIDQAIEVKLPEPRKKFLAGIADD